MAEMELKELVDAVLGRVMDRIRAPNDPVPRAEELGGPDQGLCLVAGNWKMNLPARPDSGKDPPSGPSELLALLHGYVSALADAPLDLVKTVLLPPALLLWPLARVLSQLGERRISLGIQSIHQASWGAHTGEISAPLLAAAGGAWTLVGHSERRQAGETETEVSYKVPAGLSAGLNVILCVGEHTAQRKARDYFRVLRNQVMSALCRTTMSPPRPDCLTVAYEPVWAIGTGETASADQIQEASAFIRKLLSETYSFSLAKRMRILYGGSVTADNTSEIMSLPDVDGLLVGGASLKGESFRAIVEKAARASAKASGLVKAGAVR